MQPTIEKAREYASSFKPNFDDSESTFLYFQRIDAFVAGSESVAPTEIVTKDLFEAIELVTRVHREDIISKSHKRNTFYAKILYAHHRHKDASEYVISTELNRDRTTILYYFKKYQDLYDYVPDFRRMADKVDRTLIK